MAKSLEKYMDKKIIKKSEIFIDKVEADMSYKAELPNDSLDFEWISEFEYCFPYIDNIVRVPKLTLVTEEDTVKIEKARKITVASVKDLSRHTQYIDKLDKKTQDVQPSKILIQRYEETYNTYENRFLFTLLDSIIRFMAIQDNILDNLEIKNHKFLEYKASTNNGKEKINIELKITSKDLEEDNNKNNNLADEIDDIKSRVKRLKDYVNSWQRSEFFKAMSKVKSPFVKPPIKKTNLILKNPNFQTGLRLWLFLQTYGLNENDPKNILDSNGDNTLRSILNDAFLMDYYVLDAIASKKKEQKENLAKYAVVMLNQQVSRVISLLMNCGIKITEEDLFKLITQQMEDERNKRLVGSEDVKKKFKSAIEEYLEKSTNYL